MNSASGISIVKRAAAWAGLSLAAYQLDQLERLAVWLTAEDIPSGGLGPSEGPVVHSRHLADFLLFASAWNSPSQPPPRRVLDVGAGVGLPGVPLAIVWPTTQVVLLERSVRGADLARRAILLLGLDNVTVATEQLQEWRAPADFIVSRSVSSPLKLRRPLSRLLLPSGVAAIGGSHRSRPNVVGYRVSEFPEKGIGKPVWLLIMKGA